MNRTYLVTFNKKKEIEIYDLTAYERAAMLAEIGGSKNPIPLPLGKIFLRQKMVKSRQWETWKVTSDLLKDDLLEIAELQFDLFIEQVRLTGQMYPSITEYRE